MYDTSVKVPMIISRYNDGNRLKVCDELLSHYDLMPTILEYTGISNEISENLPGKSFAPLLMGQHMEQRGEVVIMDEYGPVRMIRTKEWKYVHRYPYGPNELYDMVNDKNEKFNLIEDASKKDIIENMKLRLEKWFIKYADPKVDGRNEAVTGLGQINLAGIKNGGKKAFIGNKIPKYY
jgi:arylsulfatase A-like enzyme